jgi:hypothetical protein
VDDETGHEKARKGAKILCLPGARQWLRRSAEFQSAVSQNFILPGVRKAGRPVSFVNLADWKSAIRQSETLRYAEQRQNLCAFARLLVANHFAVFTEAICR